MAPLVSPTKIQAQGIDLTTTVSTDSNNALTTDANELLKVAKASTVTVNGSELVPASLLYAALGGRAAIVTDAVPTSGSSNLMTSGSIYTALQGIADDALGRIVWSEVPSGSINGTNKTFTLANTPVSGKLMLFYNGVLLASSDYSVSGKTITMNTYTPESGDSLEATYLKSS